MLKIFLRPLIMCSLQTLLNGAGQAYCSASERSKKHKKWNSLPQRRVMKAREEKKQVLTSSKPHQYISCSWVTVARPTSRTNKRVKLSRGWENCFKRCWRRPIKTELYSMLLLKIIKCNKYKSKLLSLFYFCIRVLWRTKSFSPKTVLSIMCLLWIVRGV